ncbi:type III restriction-modification system endonuclease [Gaopeijia maritima]
MKFRFDPDLEYQREAISSVLDVFRGQEQGRTSFTVVGSGAQGAQLSAGAVLDESLGIGNRLRIIEEDLLSNVQEIQVRNGIKPSAAIDALNFTVEMETGTGKTYVYLRTILELNQEYGFTKFVIVVPSVAIKEGVNKSIEIMRSHFDALYDNTPFDAFVYSSSDLPKIRSFATSDQIQIMVINIDAFRRSFDDPADESKSANIIHRAHEGMSWMKPIDFIRETHPIVIIDEPQSVDTTKKSREAIASLNPLCTFRYSATHVDKHHMLYRLDAVDAFEKKLVKQIEVAELQSADSHNSAYVHLRSVNNRGGGIKASVELDVELRSGTVSRVNRTVSAGDDLHAISGGREAYLGYIVDDIYQTPDGWVLSFAGGAGEVGEGETLGGMDPDAFRRMQIRHTIETHLDKELRLNPRGIKVLSLFFIDRVANYREYDQKGVPTKGKYARWFEEEFRVVADKAKYRTLFQEIDLDIEVERVHDGYFAIDRKTDSKGRDRFKESRTGAAKSDESAYALIMRDKERLLRFDRPLRFIFSHSALREGWDNPNVFQICTLNESNSVIKKRQEIGRGLRICVDQSGKRVPGFEVNTLTVMANESYEDFVKALQKELEEDTGIRFGIVDVGLFVDLPFDGDEAFGAERAESIVKHLRDAGYIDGAGNVKDELRLALRAGEVSVPEEFEEKAGLIVGRLRKAAGSLDVKRARNRRQVEPNKAVLLSDEFKELWARIRPRTTYRVQFDSEKLIDQCADEIHSTVMVNQGRVLLITGKVEVARGGLASEDMSNRVYDFDPHRDGIPDILGYLQDKTELTRRTLAQILVRSGKLHMLKNNPQKFLEQVLTIIRRKMQLMIVDGIKYEQIDGREWYEQDLFENQELHGYLNENMIESTKSPYDHVVYDLGVERGFAEELEQSDDVKVYAKLPSWFKIDTPLGGYNPDWAVLVEHEGSERLYFVVETKGTLFTDALRATEKAKINCGRKHIEALENGARFEVADSFITFQEKW